MAKPFRLAVLECDVPFPGVVEVHGSYGDIFRDLLGKGMRGLEGAQGKTELQVTKWDVVNAHVYPVFEDFDGLLISGSSKWKEMLSGYLNVQTANRNRLHPNRAHRF